MSDHSRTEHAQIAKCGRWGGDGFAFATFCAKVCPVKNSPRIFSSLFLVGEFEMRISHLL